MNVVEAAWKLVNADSVQETVQKKKLVSNTFTAL